MQAYERLDALLTRLHPRHASTRRPPSLDADAPARMSALWQAVGRSEATSFAPLQVLDREESQRALASVFEDWFADVKLRDLWNVTPGDDSAAWARLPERYHVVAISGSAGIPSEVALTDETTPADDPPVLVLRPEGGPLSLWHTSYAAWAIWTILRRVTAFRRARFDPRSNLAGPALLAPIYPRLEELAEGVWRMREPGFVRTDVRPADPDIVFYQSLTRYLEFARSLPDEALSWLNPPASALLIVDSPGFDLALPGFRVFEPASSRSGPSRQRCALGRLDGADVWLQTSSAPEVLIRYNPRDEEPIRRWLNERGMPIRSGQPMRDGYDALGW